MFNKYLFKKFLQKGGEEEMKILSLLLALTVICLSIPASASAFSLSVNAKVSGGTSLGKYILMQCYGYKAATNPATFNPWDRANCPTRTDNGSSLDFGELTTRLYDSGGQDAGGAGCFYGRDFFIVYLYPDAWGGKGYQLTQSAATFGTIAIGKACVFTPVYAAADAYDFNGDGDITDPGEGQQGALIGTETGWNPDINKDKLCTTGGQILKAKRPRIVRAQYGIPPKPGTGQSRPSGWEAIPLTQPADTYSGNITITLTEWQ